ncbi:UNVERIFIED_CONTAM: hypothetical protein GTU68_060323 [Idotea baltica]|nr:hypothetical protein [Idotea baltica]
MADQESRGIEVPDSESIENVVGVLGALSNRQRLLILCYLSQTEEVSVSDLNQHLDLSQSALSQHLAKLRNEGYVTARKDGLKVYYQIAREDISRLLLFLHQEYC